MILSEPFGCMLFLDNTSMQSLSSQFGKYYLSGFMCGAEVVLLLKITYEAKEERTRTAKKMPKPKSLYTPSYRPESWGKDTTAMHI